MTFTVKEYDQLSRVLTGRDLGKSPTKDKAANRLHALCKGLSIDPMIIAGATYAKAAAQLRDLAANAEAAITAEADAIHATCVRMAHDLIDKDAKNAKPVTALTLDDADFNANCKTLGGGQWAIAKGDVKITITRITDGFSAAIFTDAALGAVATAEAKSFSGTIRRVVAAFNSKVTS